MMSIISTHREQDLWRGLKMKNSIKNMMIAAAISAQLGAAASLQAATVPSLSRNLVAAAIADQFGAATTRQQAANVLAPSENRSSENLVTAAIASQLGGATASLEEATVTVSNYPATQNLVTAAIAAQVRQDNGRVANRYTARFGR
jgi:hypothetical protein